MTNLRTYRISATSIVGTRIPTPYFLIRDEDPNLEHSALLAGLIKGSYEELGKLLHSIARLTSVTAPQEEVRARELLDIIIKTKRTYAASETHRAITNSYEADN